MNDSAMIEKQLFTWTGGWDQFDTAGFSFYDSTLKVPMGTFQTGDTFDVINVDYEHSKIQLVRDEQIWSYHLHLTIGKEIAEEAGC